MGGNLNAIGDEKLRTAIVAWARFPDEIDDDYRIAADVTLAFRQRLARHGLFPALLSDEQPQPIPGTPTVAVATASIRLDPEAVGMLAEVIIMYLDFTDQLAVGLDLADQFLSAVSR